MTWFYPVLGFGFIAASIYVTTEVDAMGVLGAVFFSFITGGMFVLKVQEGHKGQEESNGDAD